MASTARGESEMVDLAQYNRVHGLKLSLADPRVPDEDSSTWSDLSPYFVQRNIHSARSQSGCAIIVTVSCFEGVQICGIASEKYRTKVIIVLACLTQGYAAR